MADKLSIKLQLGSEFRRFSVESTVSFNSLREHIEKIVGQTAFHLSYLDESASKQIISSEVSEYLKWKLV
jgi:hypothetical protein